jgi:hypothetical protein
MGGQGSGGCVCSSSGGRKKPSAEYKKTMKTARKNYDKAANKQLKNNSFWW